MMIKILRPNVKIKLQNLLSIRGIRTIPGRNMRMSSSCTVGHKFDVQNMLNSKDIVNNTSNDFSNGVSNDYNDYTNRDDLQIKLKEIITNRPTFINAYNDYKRKDLTVFNPNIEDYIKKYSNDSQRQNYREIVSINEDKPPSIGSFVEVLDPNTSTATFGIVLEDSQAKFNENYNKLLVLTIDNEMKKVYPLDVSFHLFKVLDPEIIASLEILDNRDNKDFANRLEIIDILKAFLEKSLELSDILQDPINNQFAIAYAQYTSRFNINCVSLPELYDSFKLSEPMLSSINASYFNQSTFLLGCHLGMVNSPDKWLVSSCYKLNKFTNVVMRSCSNEICLGSSYFVNSITNKDAIAKLFDEFELKNSLDKHNDFLRLLLEQQLSDHPRSSDDINVFFDIWEGKPFKHIINVLKYFIVYPHSLISEKLSELEVFKNHKIVPATIYEFLEDLRIYNNKHNQMTDIYLSANLMGEPHLSQLAVSTTNDLCTTMTQNESVMFIEGQQMVDKFPHLRKSKAYYNDHVIYGLPYNTPPGCRRSTLGISLEKINSRRYKINIHIPDLITKISPSSVLFDEITLMSKNMKSLRNLINGSSLNIFDTSFIDKLGFSDQNLRDESDWFSVGDSSTSDFAKHSTSEASNNTTCLTASFTFNKYDSNPFKDLEEKIEFSFDSLRSVQIKNLDFKTLEKCLDGTPELSPFTLFKERRSIRDNTSPKLNENDFHDINFIFNVMKSHIKIRNFDGASNIDPSTVFEKNDSRNLSKDLSIIHKGEDNEKVLTNIESKSLQEQMEFSKSKFLINELDKFLGKITSIYCTINEIPVFSHNQDILESLEDDVEVLQIEEQENAQPKDEVYISHNNLFLPNYHSTTFFQTLIARDSSGYVSLAAYLIGLNYLTKPRIEVFADENLRYLSLGINNGYVKMCDIFDDYEVLLNQFQILCHIQQFAQDDDLPVFKNKDYSSVSNRFSYLKRYGYNLHGPLPYQILNQQLVKLVNSYRLNDYLGTVHKQFWTLKMLEQGLLEQDFSNPNANGINGIIYDCIISSTGYEIPTINSRVARGYCHQMNIEVDILLSLDRDITIGNQIDCDKIMFLDPVGGQCILKESQNLH